MLRLLICAIAVVVGCLSRGPAAWAQHIPVNIPSIRADMSGNWFNPEQDGHGIQLEVLDNGRVALAWYTYDINGEPLWLFGVGTAMLTTIQAELLCFTGGRPPDRID